MKLHAYPKLLFALGALTVSAISGSAAYAVTDASALAVERSAPSIAQANGSQSGAASVPEKTLLGLLGKPAKSAAQAVCGDSEPDVGEQCDDGNLANGDGCDATCNIEIGSDCTVAIAGMDSANVIGDGSFENNDGSWILTGTAFNPRCSPTTCGPDLATDGQFYLWIGGGFFDGGNGGTATQTLVIPANATALTFEWAVGSNAPPPDLCESPAQDRLEVLIDGVELFRSPNPCETPFPFITSSIDLAAAGVADGASHTIEFRGFNVDNPANPPGSILTNFFVDNVRLDVPLENPIPPVPSACLVGVCGDAIFTSGEGCDDGNAIDGDGCSATCQVEDPDFICSDPVADSFDILNSSNGDAIIEGSLEDGRGRISGAWTESRVGAQDLLPICTEVFCSFISINIASDGIFYALFGASADPSDTSISQTTTIPSTATVLEFDLLVAICDSADDELTVTIDDVTVFSYPCTAEIDDYTTQSVDISAFADDADHTITIRGNTLATNGGNTNFFVDNISIPLPSPIDLVPSNCIALDTACDVVETFDAGIPAGWTVVNLSADPADGWGSIGDGTCLAENAAGLLGATGTENLTASNGGAACADSDATGQVDNDNGGSPTEMDTFLCSPAMDLSNITAPRYSFNTNYQSANNQFNDNGTPDDFTDDFDEDLLEVLVGTLPPNALSLTNYTRLGGVNDHEDGDLLLTGAQELSANLEGTLEGEEQGFVCFHYVGTFAWFAQIDNAGLRGDDCNLPPLNSDTDAVFDSVDNCTLTANPNQTDSNGDGIGNRCDADLDNNCSVNFLDLSQFVPAFNSVKGAPNYNPDADFNSDGNINFLDFILIQQSFNGAPGPSANECVPGLGN